ncbi:hypothetical protein TeGR_g8484 [Tetraparma gracilis]|uniref:Transmembrane protein n=1 Tax=Tetraparma gracilis TaxID=2962635 RepID=A0ABQ6MWL3_9STRA|nr:hypothetical protein TeGR_g8484 [Tetraparma gracilis]
MLAADRQAVQTDLLAQAVQVKNLEMTNIDRYLQAIGTQAALVCAFAVGQNYCVELADSTWAPFIIAYYTSNTLCLVLEFYCIMNSTMVCVLGPTFALNGPSGSMHEAVKAMKEERLSILRAFWYGGLMFALSEVFAVIIVCPAHTSIPSSLILIVGFLSISRNLERIKVKFQYDAIYAGEDDGKGTVAAPPPSKVLSLMRRLSGAGSNAPPPNTEGRPSGEKMNAGDFLKRSSMGSAEDVV